MNTSETSATAKYRKNLPQLSGDLFLTDGGIETTLIFHKGFELPEFAAFDLLNNDAGYSALKNYFSTYAGVANKYGVGFILESPTWRSSPGWGQKLGYSEKALVQANKQAIQLVSDVRVQYENPNTPIVISGCIGPSGDGYNPVTWLTETQAEKYHTPQIQTFAETEADMVTALTMTYAEEAIGIVRAAQAADLPVVISFTVETDGKLPSGQTIKNAIEQVDAATNSGPVYYMINCAHPTHFENSLPIGEKWVERLRGIRANASCLSHAELDEAEELDDGNPVELGFQYRQLKNRLPRLNVLGGCCGTDHRHIEAICQACIPEMVL